MQDKARLGNFVCTLPSSDMRLIDEAIAKTVGLMGYYADLSRKLNDKLSYIDRIKEDRDKAQDELAMIRDKLGLAEAESLIDCILVFLESNTILMQKKEIYVKISSVASCISINRKV